MDTYKVIQITLFFAVLCIVIYGVFFLLICIKGGEVEDGGDGTQIQYFVDGILISSMLFSWNCFTTFGI